MEDIIITEVNYNENVEINIDGYKHVFVTIVSAILAKNVTVTLKNVPNIYDTKQIISILQSFGKIVEYNPENKEMTIFRGKILNSKLDNALSSTIHGSIYLFIGVTIAWGCGEINQSGGCKIGTSNEFSSRPEHHFFEVMKLFGINSYSRDTGERVCVVENLDSVDIDINNFEGDNPLTSNLHSGATKAAILCSLGLKSGNVKIMNPYLKPDVTELLNFIEQLGYKVIQTTDFIEIAIQGVETNSTTFSIMPDISEIISFISFSIYNKQNIKLIFGNHDKVKRGLKEEFKILENMGVPFYWKKDGILIRGSSDLIFQYFDITVTSSTIFSDSQPFFAILGLLGNGISRITEGIWISRFDYAKEAKKLGIPFEVDENTLLIYPFKDDLIKTDKIRANDLRAAFALLIIACKYKELSNNNILIQDFYHVHRGYGGIYEKLNKLGIGYEILK